MKIDKAVLLNQIKIMNDYEVERMFNDSLEDIMSSKQYLNFLEYLKDLQTKGVECEYITLYPFDYYKGSGKITKIHGPMGLSDGTVELEDGSFNPARVIKVIKHNNKYIFIINR
jgi:hypothetical protein